MDQRDAAIARARPARLPVITQTGFEINVLSGRAADRLKGHEGLNGVLENFIRGDTRIKGGGDEGNRAPGLRVSNAIDFHCVRLCYNVTV